jgi:hypothetical protein
MRRLALASLLIAGLLPAPGAQAPTQAPGPPSVKAPALAPLLTDKDQETFLLKARIGTVRTSSKGITGTRRATLSDGVRTHDASIQTIDEYKDVFQSMTGTELNFRDSWRYNVAAYRLDRLLELHMTPVSVERVYNRMSGSFTWWIDDVLMDEGQRLKDGVDPPDPAAWNEQMWVVRVFDQLIANADRNTGNLLIDQAWNIWMIDHTRAFRIHKDLKTPANLTRCDRALFARLKALDKPTLARVMKGYLYPPEIDALLARRDRIVSLFEEKGETAFYDRQARR